MRSALWSYSTSAFLTNTWTGVEPALPDRQLRCGRSSLRVMFLGPIVGMSPIRPVVLRANRNQQRAMVPPVGVVQRGIAAHKPADSSS